MLEVRCSGQEQIFSHNEYSTLKGILIYHEKFCNNFPNPLLLLACAIVVEGGYVLSHDLLQSSNRTGG